MTPFSFSLCTLTRRSASGPIRLLAICAFAASNILLLPATAMHAEPGREKPGQDQPGVEQASRANGFSSRAGLITQPINESVRVTLTGSTLPLVTQSTGQIGSNADLGAVPASMPANRMLLLLKRSPERESELRAAIQAMHDGNSPSFHHWLTPAQFGSQWGAVDSDIASVTAWLQSHGFSVKGATAGRTAIEFSGTAGQIQEAFHTSIHLYRVNGELHHANSTDPQIPAALAPVVAGIATLNDFHPRSMAKAGPRGIYDVKTGKIRPDYTSSSSSGEFLYVGPGDAAAIYNTPNKALNPNAGGATFDGSGVKIGILGDSNISLAQTANYRNLFGLSSNAPTVIIDGSTDPGENGDAVEAYLDTEVAGGIAPGAKVYLYTAADTDTDTGLTLATARAVNDNIVDVLNVSFGQCEAGLAYPGNQFYASMWEQAAAQGISVTVSAGDSGSAACDDSDQETAAIYGLQVNGLASTQFDIAVGGTDFAALAGPNGGGSNFGNYASATNGSGTLRSVDKYIPEVPWNNSILNYPPGGLAGNEAFSGSAANTVAGGGGKSNCSQGYFNGTGKPYCVAGYLKPSWQQAPGVPADNARDIPDVSMFAANGHYFAAWGICTDQDQDANGKAIADCTLGSNGLPANEFYIYGVGGTSAAAPAFAGVLALVNQATGERQGQADYVLYNLARTKPAVYHDTTSGNNAVPCENGTLDCTRNGRGAEFLKGYNAGVGYDLASGLGSVDVSALIADWASAGLTSTTTQLTLGPSTTIQHGEIVNADATVTTSTGNAATGDVALSAYANPPSFALGSSIGTYPLIASGSEAGSTGSLPINHLPGGTYKVFGTYGGSSSFAESVSAPVEVTVAPETSTTAILVSAYDPATSNVSATAQYGYYLGITANPYGKRSPIVNGSVDPDGTATGNITFAANGKTLGTIGLSSMALATYNITTGNQLNAGRYTITAAYSGDNSFDPSIGSQPLDIIKAPTRLSLSASARASAGKAVTFKVVLGSDSKGIAPTGIVVLRTATGTGVLAGAQVVGVGASDNAPATATATISTDNFPLGMDSLTATYEGDVNYDAATSNSVEITGKPYFRIADATTNIPSEHSTSSVYAVTTSYDGYAGTINYTCQLVGTYPETSPPECAFFPSKTAQLTAGGTAGPEVLIFGKGTKLPKGVTIGGIRVRPGDLPDDSGLRRKLGMGAGISALACCLLFGIPARRRGWKALLSMILLLAAFSAMTACASKGKFISAGKYTFQVVGTDSADSTNTATATITVGVE